MGGLLICRQTALVCSLLIDVSPTYPMSCSWSGQAGWLGHFKAQLRSCQLDLLNSLFLQFLCSISTRVEQRIFNTMQSWCCFATRVRFKATNKQIWLIQRPESLYSSLKDFISLLCHYWIIMFTVSLAEIHLNLPKNIKPSNNVLFSFSFKK